MKNKKNDQVINKLSKDIQQSGLVIFAGAGISVPQPCFCPTWQQLRLEILSRMLDKLLKEDWSIKSYLEEIKPHILGINMRPEMFMWTLATDIGFIKAIEMIKGLDTSTPNFNHLAIAVLAKEGILKAIVTSNFDTYLEKAFDALPEPIKYTVVRDENEAEVWLRGTREGIVIFKPHGCISKYWSLKYRIDQIQSLSHYKEELLSQVLGSTSVLVIGYSGNDEDIFPTFTSGLINNKNPAYICVYPKSPKDEPISKWDTGNYRHIHRFLADSEDVMNSLISASRLQGKIRSLTSKIQDTQSLRETKWKETIARQVDEIPHDIIAIAISHLCLIHRDYHRTRSFADLARDIIEDTDLSLSSYESMMFIRELHEKASRELEGESFYTMPPESKVWEALERDGKPVEKLGVAKLVSFFTDLSLLIKRKPTQLTTPEKLASNLIDEAFRMQRNNDLAEAERALTLAGTYLYKKRIKKGPTEPDFDFTTWLWYSGILCRKQSKYEEANRFFDRAINIAYDQGDYINCGRMLLDYGLLRRDIFDYDGARQLFNQAKEFAAKTNDRETLQKANNADMNIGIEAAWNKGQNR